MVEMIIPIQNLKIPCERICIGDIELVQNKNIDETLRTDMIRAYIQYYKNELKKDSYSISEEIINGYCTHIVSQIPVFLIRPIDSELPSDSTERTKCCRELFEIDTARFKL